MGCNSVHFERAILLLVNYFLLHIFVTVNAVSSHGSKRLKPDQGAFLTVYGFLSFFGWGMAMIPGAIPHKESEKEWCCSSEGGV